MSIELNEQAGGKILVVRLTGKLTTEDYARFPPVFDRLIQRFGKLRMLVQMHDFHGWTAGAGWEDFKFGLKHFRDVERIAMVGERTWEHALALFWKPFTMAKIRYFDRNQMDQAEAWVHADMSANDDAAAPSA